MRRGFAAPFILLGIVLLLLVAGGAYYLGKQSSLVPTPQPSATSASTAPAASLPSDSDKNAIVNKVREYLASKGVKPDNISSINPELFSKDVYTVNYTFINSGPSEPSYVLVGKVNGKWVVGTNYDENYCRWVKESNADEATRAFMGYTDHCK